MNNNSLYDIFDNGVVRVAITGALSILAIFLLAQTINTAQSFDRSGSPATDTITVQGEGRAALPQYLSLLITRRRQSLMRSRQLQNRQILRLTL
jgi:hypothetical protein